MGHSLLLRILTVWGNRSCSRIRWSGHFGIFCQRDEEFMGGMRGVRHYSGGFCGAVFMIDVLCWRQRDPHDVLHYSLQGSCSLMHCSSHNRQWCSWREHTLWCLCKMGWGYGGQTLALLSRLIGNGGAAGLFWPEIWSCETRLGHQICALWDT